MRWYQYWLVIMLCDVFIRVWSACTIDVMRLCVLNRVSLGWVCIIGGNVMWFRVGIIV